MTIQHTDEYNHEWLLWDTDNPLSGAIICPRSDLAEEFAKYQQPKFRLVGNMYMMHNGMGEEVRIWHYRRYPLRDEVRQ